MTYPTIIEINSERYEINSSYLDAIACLNCIQDAELGDTERAYGVIELLYKEPPEDAGEALRLAVKYLQLGKDNEAGAGQNEDPDMSYEYDMHYIRSSFRSDYGIDLNKKPGMHWWEFAELLQGLTDNCILNRIRDLRNYDLSEISDPKARSKMAQAQREVALPEIISEEEQKRLKDFYDQIKR